jgi:hypothetical protein
MDVNGRGTVRFTEWCNYLTAAEVVSGTLMGSLIADDALNGDDGDLKSDDGTAREEQVHAVLASRVTVEPALKGLEATNQVSRRGVLSLLLLLLIAALVLARLTGNDAVDSTREGK